VNAVFKKLCCKSASSSQSSASNPLVFNGSLQSLQAIGTPREDLMDQSSSREHPRVTIRIVVEVGTTAVAIVMAAVALAQEPRWGARQPLPAIQNQCPSGYSHVGAWCEPRTGDYKREGERQPMPDIDHSCPSGFSHQGGPQGSPGWCIPNPYRN
jgi:hypothetical protein